MYVMYVSVMCVCVCVSGVKPPAERQRPKDARGTQGRTAEPLAVHTFPRLPRKSDRQSGRDQGTPDGRQRDTGVYSRALGSAHCPTPATQKPAAERRRPRDTGRTLGGHWGVQPSPWQCTVSHACHAKASGRAAETKGHRTDARGTLGRAAEPVAVHSLPRLPSPWQCTVPHASHAKATGRAAETKGHRTDARGTRLPRKATGRAAETKGHRTDARGTPGRTAEPLAVHSVPRLQRKSHR